MPAIPPITPVFDGHNDVLLRLWLSHRDNPAAAFLDEGASGQMDLPRMLRGGFAGGLFAVYVPSPSFLEGIPEENFSTPSLEEAQKTAFAMIAILLRIERASQGRVRICRSAAEIRQAMADKALAVVLHIEGAEALDEDLHLLDILWQAGLRTLGPLWSRNNIFGQGVPFRFPSTPDTGNGLTPQGIALIKACNQRRIMVDLSHMDERGFWQTAEVSDAPLVASHSNAHALCAQSRNLTDRQLDAIRESRGLVGVNFGVRFLKADGTWDPQARVDEIVRHVDYLVNRLGEDHVGFGSDFDGTEISEDMRDVAGLPLLVDALRERGYDQKLVDKLTHQNWINVLERTWGG